MKIVIIGCGPSGLMCAIKASENKNNEIILLDHNEKSGKKLFITGKGRCNVCNFCSNEEFLNNVVNNPKFLYGVIKRFSPQDTFDFFEKQGVKLKIERGKRVFPVSDKASDITKGLLNAINKKNTKIFYNTNVEDIKKDDENFIVKCKNQLIKCDAVVVATGGKSYSSTGSTGDGYKFAKNFGHNIIEPKPALVPIRIKDFDKNLAGLSLKNVSAKINIDNKNFTEFGEMLFTHNGVSGPIILTLSSLVNKYSIENKNLIIDLKPALDEKTLDNRLIRDFEQNKRIILKNYLKELMPKTLIDYFLKISNLDSNTKLCDITKEMRKNIIFYLKNLPFVILGLDNIDFGIITSGGVDTKEINPKQMESKIVKNLFFVGEVVDIDALTGGFNIQIALSTGFCCGDYLSKEII